MRNRSKMEKVLAKSIVLGLTVGMFATMATINVASAFSGDGGTATGTGAIAIGGGSSATGNGALAVGVNSEAPAVNSSALGINNKILSATSEAAVALGSGNTADGRFAVSVGAINQATAESSIAVGNNNKATALAGTAVGYGNEANGSHSVGLGNYNIISTERGVGVGASNTVNASNASAFGGSNKIDAGADYSLAAGFNNHATKIYAVALGANTSATGGSSVAIGGDYVNPTTAAHTTTNATALGAVALGSGTNATKDDAVAIGTLAVANGEDSIALGNGANTNLQFQTAIGHYTLTTGTNATAVGANSRATGANSLALGSLANAATNNSVALGASSVTGAANTGTTAQSYSHNVAGTSYGGTYAGLATDAKGTVSIGAAGAERQLQNVAAGNITATSTDAVNGSQLYQTNQVVNAIADKIGTVTTTANGVSNTNTVGQNIDALNNAIGTTTTGNYVTNTNSVGQNLNALDTQVKTNADNIATNTTNITNIQTALSNGYTFGADDANDSVAVGKTLLVKGDGNNITTTFTKDATSGNGTIKVEMSANPDFTSLKIGGDTYIDANGINANDKKVQNVAAGTLSSTSKDAVNGSQLYQTNQNLGDINNYSSTNIVNNGDSAVDAIGKLDAATGDQNYNNVTGTGSVTDGMSTTDAIGTINNSVGNVNNYSSNNYITNGASLVDSVGALDNQVGINASNINKLGDSLGDLDTRVNKVGAASAALASLHPLDFDPDAKWDFAAGYGHYKNANSAAIGAFYRPDEDTMFSVGTTFGSENMINAGVSLKVGRGNHISTSRVAMAKELVDLRNQVKELTALVKGGMGSGAGLTAQTAQFPDVPENHWAYDMVSKLAGNGIVTGYPDGSYKGDRSMTRYEMAAMIYRAMSKGAQVDGKLLNEFKPELERIRVDGKKIQRVHVVK